MIAPMYDEDYEEQPWPSGLIPDGEREGSPTDELERRVAQLELTVMALVELLAERGHIGRIELPNKVADIERRTNEARAAAEVARAERDAAARDMTVTCAGCGAQLPKSESFYSSRGVVCPSCHAVES